VFSFVDVMAVPTAVDAPGRGDGVWAEMDEETAMFNVYVSVYISRCVAQQGWTYV
jgi:hypothetical protein